MRIRNFAPFLAIAGLACGAETAEETAATEEPQEYAATADAASLAAMTADWQTHYNMGHASVVAGYFAEDGLMWSGSAGMAFGSDAIAAALQGGIEAASPQLSIVNDEQIVVGNLGLARGTYTSEGTMDGQATVNSGGWMTFAEMIDGEWKIHGLISSIPAGQAAAGFTHSEMPAVHESAAMVAEGTEFFQTHLNMGHAEMVAERYAEDVVLIGSEENGRAALLATLQGMVDAGAQVTVTPFAAGEVGDEYVASIGTFTITVDGATTMGHYSNVATKNEDGTLTTVWSLTSQHPAGM